MTYRTGCISLLFLLILSPGALAEWKMLEKPDRVQVFLGVMEIDDDTGELQNETGEPVDVDFDDNLATIGIEVETPWGKNREEGFEYGINAGGGISWSGDGTEFRGTVDRDGAQGVFLIDNSFALFEFHFGGYIRTHLGKFADIYIGGGPAIVFGTHDVEDTEDEDGNPIEGSSITLEDGTVILLEDSDNDIVFGFYGRAGIEFDVGQNSQMGIGIRYLGADMEFSDTVGDLELGGVQYLLTYSAWF